MSLLRQRAIDVRVESTRSERSPALARAWLVRVTSSRSDAELNELLLQPRTTPGVASSPSDVTTNASAVNVGRRRKQRLRARGVASVLGFELSPAGIIDSAFRAVTGRGSGVVLTVRGW